MMKCSCWTVAKVLISVVAAVGCFTAPAKASVDDDIDPLRRYDQVTFLTSHNAFTSSEDGWLYAQQVLSVPNQLNFGVRGLMLDIHLAQGGTEVKECKDVTKEVTVVEDQCKKVARQDCRNVKKTKQECKNVSKKVCDWAPWPADELCKTVTETVCTPVDFFEKVCENVDDLVCSPVTVSKLVTETVCGVTKVIPSGDKNVRLCHEQSGDTNCSLTRTIEQPLQVPRRLAQTLTQIRQFLDKNRNAVVTVFFESYVGNKDKVDHEFAQSGINKYLFDQETWLKQNNNTWPTIKKMRDDNKRLVVFTGGNNDGTPKDGRPNNWDYVVETKYNLAEFSKCEIRSETDKNINNAKVPILTMNHFFKFTPGQPILLDVASPLVTNSYSQIMNRVKICQTGEVKRTPNFIALDFLERGDGLKVVKELNRAKVR